MDFSFNRFLHLLKMQLVVNRKLYILGLLAMAGIFLAFLIFLATQGLDYDIQSFTYIVGLILASTIFTSTIFKQFTKKESRTASIMLPASVAERLAVAILLAIVVFPLIFTLIAIPCLKIGHWIDFQWGHRASILFMPGTRDDLIGSIVNFAIQSFVLLGAVWFRKQAFVKSVVLLAVLVFGFTLLNDAIAKTSVKEVYPEEWAAKRTYFRYFSAFPYYNIVFSNTVVQQDGTPNIGSAPTYQVKLPGAFSITILILLFLLPFFLWYITALKLKEQQV